MPTAVTTTTCPACAAPASGQFCASCGASLSGATCAGCRASLTPGARFCHRCGTPAGAAAPTPARAARDPLPWAVALIALCALIALVGGQRFAAARGAGLDAPQNAIPQAGLDFPAAGGQSGMRAPDISSMSPQERANRLYNRIMTLHEQGKTDSVQFIALNMFIPQLRSMEPLDAHLRYDLGRVGEVAGTADVATAQADTILRQHPNHLLGLILASRAARMRGDEAAALAFDRKALAAEPGERAKRLEEYEAHAADIDNGLAEARRVVK
jgi:hypothetical protein